MDRIILRVLSPSCQLKSPVRTGSLKFGSFQDQTGFAQNATPYTTSYVQPYPEMRKGWHLPDRSNLRTKKHPDEVQQNRRPWEKHALCYQCWTRQKKIMTPDARKYVKKYNEKERKIYRSWKWDKACILNTKLMKNWFSN